MDVTLLGRLTKRLIDWVYPADCVLCGARDERQTGLCEACLNDLPFNLPCCQRCALPLAGSSGSLCGRCQKRAPPFELCQAPLRYEGPVAHLITELKFHARLAYAPVLSKLLGDQVAMQGPPLPELLLPVPLHPSRLRERGFNQAIEIARPVARRFGIPIETGGCRRQRATRPQAGLNALERRKNLHQAFQLRSGLTQKHVAIVDDVVTTGHTAGALASLLKRNGVKRVDVWAVARTAEHW